MVWGVAFGLAGAMLGPPWRLLLAALLPALAVGIFLFGEASQRFRDRGVPWAAFTLAVGSLVFGWLDILLRLATRWPDRLSVAAGLFAVAAGAWIRQASVRELGEAVRRGSLAVTGLYAESRHPQYVGACLLLAGGFLPGDPWAAVVVALGVGNWLWTAARMEERAMERRFGEAYARYAESTPRFLGLGRWQR